MGWRTSTYTYQGMQEMKSGTRRGLAAAVTVVLAAATNATVGMLTQHWALAWWLASGVIVIVGAGLQWWLTDTGGDKNSTSQQVDRTSVAGSLQQKIHGTGRQSVARSSIFGDLSQIQDSDGDGGS